MFTRLKHICGDFSMKSSCMSTCCNKANANIDVDFDGDGQPDLHIGLHEGKIDIDRPTKEQEKTNAKEEKNGNDQR